jgi:universal stress protein E
MAFWGKPAYEAVVRRAIATRADLVISGTHARGLAERFVLRHTDWELVRYCPVPLLLVKSGRQVAKAVVLAAIDPLHANAKPAQLDGRILEAASAMAIAVKGTLHAFHSYMPLSVTMAAGIGEPVAWDSSQIDTNYTQLVAREFTRALRKTAIPPSRRHLLIGNVAVELAASARRLHATLIVMGAGRGRGGTQGSSTAAPSKRPARRSASASLAMRSG